MEVMGFPVVTGWTPGLILAGLVIMVFTGRLIPKSQHDREIKFRDDLLEKADREAADWKSVAINAMQNSSAALNAAGYITAGESASTRLVETMQNRFTPPANGDNT